MQNTHSSMSAAAIRTAIIRDQSPTNHEFPTLVKLTFWLQCAETQVRNGKQFDNGELWYAGWKRCQELREQINTLQAVAGM